MSKQTMVMVLSDHADLYWDHSTGKAHCDCDVELCGSEETSAGQHWRLREHQADQMLEAGLGLTRPAEAEAWRVGHGAGWNDCLLDLENDGAKMSENPYEN